MSVPVYLLAGESFLSEEALDRIRSEEQTDHLAEDSFGADVETAELMSALETPSLLGGRRMVVVHDADQLRKEQIEALERYLSSPSPHSVLVLVSPGRSKLEGTVKKVGAVIGLDAPKGRRLVSWIVDRGRSHGLRIEERGAWTLIDAVGTELRDLDGAMSQMVTGFGPGSKIGANEVKQMFARLADERIFGFTDAVGDRRLPQAMAALRRLLDQGDEPLMVFGALTSQIRRMLRARRYADQGPKVLADAMRLPGWRAERLHKQARSYREEELVAAMEILADTDVEMKGGDLSPEVALERAVIQIVTGARNSAPLPFG